MCLRSQGIDDDDGVVNRVIRSRGLSDDGGGIGRGQGIDDASKGLETTTEAAGARKQDQGIYNDNRGLGGGI